MVAQRVYQMAFMLGVVLASGAAVPAEEGAAEKVHRSTAPWRASVQEGDRMHFLFQDPSTIETYDLATGAWLPSLALSGTPFAFTVDGDDFYVAFSRQVVKVSRSAEPALLATSDLTYEWIVDDGPFFFTRSGDRIESRNKSDGALLSSRTESFAPMAPVIDSARRLIVGTNGVFSGYDIVRMP